MATAKKPVAKKPAAKKPVVKAPEPKKVESEGKLLYTIRLEPEYIAKIEAEGVKRGVKHAVVAREIIHSYFATKKA